MTRGRSGARVAWVLASLPSAASAAGVDGRDLSLVWVLPFVALLASIAFLPLIAGRLWHTHFEKVVFAWTLVFAIPFALSFGAAEATQAIAHALLAEYVPFVALVFALYTVSGGIALVGDLRGTPAVNVAFLATGAVLANVMGTTGAAMILIRPLIRANAGRPHRVHVVVFFILLVANAGGALTPLGDPPLFLGYLNGVSFFWTMSALLAPTLTLWSLLLVAFWLLDRRLGGVPPVPTVRGPRLRIVGKVNFVLLAAIVATVLTSGDWTSDASVVVAGNTLLLRDLVRDVVLVDIGLVSLALTPRAIHAANGFSWGPMVEVATLFAAIFVTMIPALAILQAGEDGAVAALVRAVRSPDGAANPAVYFWLTGLLSAFLDNAPTYLAFFNLAGGDAARLMAEHDALAAISAGAVYMGALSYLGNAPNFMIRAIALDRGVPMPSFFGYMAWSCGILLPCFVLLTILFFR